MDQKIILSWIRTDEIEKFSQKKANLNKNSGIMGYFNFNKNQIVTEEEIQSIQNILKENIRTTEYSAPECYVKHQFTVRLNKFQFKIYSDDNHFKNVLVYNLHKFNFTLSMREKGQVHQLEIQDVVMYMYSEAGKGVIRNKSVILQKREQDQRIFEITIENQMIEHPFYDFKVAMKMNSVVFNYNSVMIQLLD